MKLVSTLALVAAMTFTAVTDANAQNPADTAPGVPGPAEDPFIWLEEARSEEALDWVRAENERTLAALESDPR
ncbi:MAG: S9 family peptidase, partial [Erythrobacter sp.]